MIKLYPKGEFQVPSIVYIPDGVAPEGLPIFIYLHGKGEHGDGSTSSLLNYLDHKGHLPNWLAPKDYNDNINLQNGIFKGLKIGSEYYKPPFVICCPLTEKDVVLEGKMQFDYVQYVMDRFKTTSVGIGGISFGGKGTLKARVQYPGLFKCFLPMAPAYLTKENMTPCDAPMWSHHGANDNVVHPNWSVWNSEYSSGTKGRLEVMIKMVSGIKALADLNKIDKDLDLEFDSMIGWGSPIATLPFDDACSIYAGKGHGIQHHVLHQKIVWYFLEYHLGEAKPPEPEARPLKDVDTVDLLLYYNSYDGSVGDEFKAVENELMIRAEVSMEAIKNELSS